MDFGIVGDLVNAAASFFGQKSANQTNIDLAGQSNAFNAEQATLNREWQESMRATQYQTAVKDMQAAGLNPMLAYSQGGSGNLGGSTASSVAPPRVESPVAAGIHSAYESARTRSEQQNVHIKKPLETGSEMVDKGLKVVEDSIKPISESIKGLVQKIEDKLSTGSISSAGAAAVTKVTDAAKDAAIGIADVIGQSAPARALASGVSSALDAKDSVVKGAVSVRDALAKGRAQAAELQSQEKSPRARHAAGEPGFKGRLGTLQRSPRWAPEYGRGE